MELNNLDLNYINLQIIQKKLTKLFAKYDIKNFGGLKKILDIN